MRVCSAVVNAVHTGSNDRNPSKTSLSWMAFVLPSSISTWIALLGFSRPTSENVGRGTAGRLFILQKPLHPSGNTLAGSLFPYSHFAPVLPRCLAAERRHRY